MQASAKLSLDAALQQRWRLEFCLLESISGRRDGMELPYGGREI
jgi:hypothetical protein